MLRATLLIGLVLAMQGQAGATLVTYTNLGSFQGAAGTTTLQNFNSTPTQLLGTPTAGTVSADLGGFTITGTSNGDYVAIASGTNPGNIDATNFLYFSQRDPSTGGYTGNGGVGPAFTLTFSSAITAFGFDYNDTDSTDSYQIAINAGVFTTPPFSNQGRAAGFFGVVATGGEAFTSVTFTQNAAGGVVDPFGVDNVRFSAEAVATPEPSTLVAAASAGLFSAAGFYRRRRRRAASIMKP